MVDTSVRDCFADDPIGQAIEDAARDFFDGVFAERTAAVGGWRRRRWRRGQGRACRHRLVLFGCEDRGKCVGERRQCRRLSAGLHGAGALAADRRRWRRGLDRLASSSGSLTIRAAWCGVDGGCRTARLSKTAGSGFSRIGSGRALAARRVSSWNQSRSSAQPAKRASRSSPAPAGASVERRERRVELGEILVEMRHLGRPRGSRPARRAGPEIGRGLGRRRRWAELGDSACGGDSARPLPRRCSALLPSSSLTRAMTS